MRVGLMILTEESWRHNVERFRTAERLGFDAVWTYDHLQWRGLRGQPWYSAVPVLAAAATATSRVTIGLMVASPNFRHPVTLAKETVTLDDISGGRFVLGIGSGSPDAGDAGVLGAPALSPAARAERFAEFVTLTDRLLRSPTVTHTGRFYRVQDAVMVPGCVQRPRVPLAVAASGPRGLALAAARGDTWISMGPTDWSRGYTAGECHELVAGQVAVFRRYCAEVGRDPDAVAKVFVSTGWAGDPLASPRACLELAERYAALGFTDLVLHWPRAEGVYAGDPAVLAEIAAEVLPRIREL